MGPRLAGLVLALVACGGSSDPMQVEIDAAPGGQCTSEAQCSAPTPYCEPASSTCVQCRFSSHCAVSNGVCENQTCRMATSCRELRAELPGLASGVYRIDLDGAGALAPLDVYCEMTVDGGGWTLVQRTRWEWSASMAMHTNFDAWYGTTVGTPAVGTGYRLAGQHWPTLMAMGELMVSHRVRTTTGGACNPLWYIGTSGTLAIDPDARTATLSNLVQPADAALIASSTLSTTDVGPDAALCINQSSGVPWFYNQCCSTCPTYMGGYWTDEPHPMAAYVGSAPDFFGRTETDVCAGQTPRTADNASVFRGIDTMEMYLR